MFNLNHRNLSPEERNRLWDARVKELSTALIAGGSTAQKDSDRSQEATSVPMSRIKTVSCSIQSDCAVTDTKFQIPPRKRRKSVQLEPLNTQASLHHGAPMSRKRSYQDRVTSTPRLHTPRTPGLSRFEDDDEEPFNPYHRTNPQRWCGRPLAQCRSDMHHPAVFRASVLPTH